MTERTNERRENQEVNEGFFFSFSYPSYDYFVVVVQCSFFPNILSRSVMLETVEKANASKINALAHPHGIFPKKSVLRATPHHEDGSLASTIKREGREGDKLLRCILPSRGAKKPSSDGSRDLFFLSLRGSRTSYHHTVSQARQKGDCTVSLAS